MSLATTGAGGGLGGGGGLSTAAMAHNTAPALIQQQHQHQQIPNAAGSGASSSLPITNVALGADLLDKNQKMLSGKGVRAVAKMPIVAVDLWGGGVAYFPPKEDNGGELKKQSL